MTKWVVAVDGGEYLAADGLCELCELCDFTKGIVLVAGGAARVNDLAQPSDGVDSAVVDIWEKGDATLFSTSLASQ